MSQESPDTLPSRQVRHQLAAAVLARKRPRLIPVWDHVVRCALGRPDYAWLWLDGRLREQDGAIRDQLRKLHQEAGLPPEVSLLRTLDD